MVKLITKTMDGNQAAADVAYAFTEVATIYPITPSSPMAEHVDAWSAHGRKNLFGQPVKLVEMQSEAGAIGAVHGASEAGSLCSTFTASQGLMLMIPVLHRLSGQLKPVVLHIAARTVGTHTMSIFGDHSDVMGCRNTGFAMLCSAGVQECADLAAVAHLSTIKGHVPFMHFFDGFRTSHEIQKIHTVPEEELKKLIDEDALYEFKHKGLNPEHPVMRSTVTNPDMYFQSKEASNIWYDRLPQIVDEYMQQINTLTGRNYKLFNYYGAEDAEDILIGMGSVTGAVQETVDTLNKQGKKTGYIQVHLYRPFRTLHRPCRRRLNALPYWIVRRNRVPWVNPCTKMCAQLFATRTCHLKSLPVGMDFLRKTCLPHPSMPYSVTWKRQSRKYTLQSV